MWCEVRPKELSAGVFSLWETTGEEEMTHWQDIENHMVLPVADDNAELIAEDEAFELEAQRILDETREQIRREREADDRLYEDSK